MSNKEILDKRGSGSEPVTKVKKFASLVAGSYWTSLVDVSDEEQGFKIKVGTTLLIKSIRWAGDVMHTVILRPHPNESDGPSEYRFIVGDFTEKFAYEPDFEKIRASEIAKIQEQADQLRDELVKAQSDPGILESVVRDELERRKESNGGDNKDNLPAVIDSSVMPVTLGDSLASGLTSDKVDAMTFMAERHKDVAIIKANWIQDKTTEIASTLTKLTPFYEERAAAALASTDEVRQSIGKMQRGIETLRLYTGKDVHVERIAKGESAPSDVPLSVVARKLFVDEELSVYLDLDKWFDFKSVELFDDALQKHPDLIDQIFPTQRCALVMAVTQRDVDYDCYWSNAIFNAENRKVFIMVRDGANIFRVISPVESHLSASNLFPSQKQMDSIFTGLDCENIEFEDIAYTDALTRHELTELHYKRFLVLCAGLDEREKLFGNFYPGNAGFGFVSLGFQNKYMRFIDDETHVIEDDKPDISTWIEKQNSYLKAGSRVLVNLRSAIDTTSAPGAFSYSSRQHSYDMKVDVPYGSFCEFVVFNQGGARMIKAELTRRFSEKKCNININLDVLRVSKYGKDGLPYMCLDRIDLEDVDYYINSRAARVFHLGFIRMLKQIRSLVSAEREKERGIREMLSNAFKSGALANSDEVLNELVDETIYTWRAFNKGAQVSSLTPKNKKAWNQLLDFAFFYSHKNEHISQIEKQITKAGYKPLRIVLTGVGQYKVYYEPTEPERDNRLIQHNWVHKSTVRLNKTKAPYINKPIWSVLPKNHAAELLLCDYEGADDWLDLPNPFKTYKNKQEVLSTIDRFQDAFTQTGIGSKISDDFCMRAIHHYQDVQDRSARYVTDTSFVLPVGVRLNRTHGLTFLCISINSILAYLHHSVDDDALKKRLKSEYVSVYGNKRHASGIVENYIDRKKTPYQLVDLPGVPISKIKKGFVCESESGFSSTGYSLLSGLPHPSEWLAEEMKESDIYLSSELVNDIELLDRLTDLEKPTDYKPYAVSAYEDDDVVIYSAYSKDADLSESDKYLESNSFHINREVGYYPSKKKALDSFPKTSSVYREKDGEFKEVITELSWELVEKGSEYYPNNSNVERYIRFKKS